MTDIDLKRLAVDREYWDSLAPEGATHYCPARKDWLNCYAVSVDYCCIHRPPKKAQEVEWDGDGLPPVGVECEFIHPGITSEGWQIGTIKAYFDDRVAIKSNPSIWPACGYAVILIDEELKFRSLKPKHERQRAELAELVLSGMKDCEYYPYETDVNSIADAILSKYNLEPKP